MKAIAPPFALSIVLASSACVAPSRPVQPAPVAAATLPAPKPVPKPAIFADWRDAPQTEGTWNWSRANGRSVAAFGTTADPAQFSLACIAPGDSMHLALRSALIRSSVSITTTTSKRELAFASAAGGLSEISVLLKSSDPLLDSIAFSRGRFMVEPQGGQPLYLPSWPEISRVVEDCR